MSLVLVGLAEFVGLSAPSGLVSFALRARGAVSLRTVACATTHRYHRLTTNATTAAIAITKRTRRSIIEHYHIVPDYATATQACSSIDNKL